MFANQLENQKAEKKAQPDSEPQTEAGQARGFYYEAEDQSMNL